MPSRLRIAASCTWVLWLLGCDSRFEPKLCVYPSETEVGYGRDCGQLSLNSDADIQDGAVLLVRHTLPRQVEVDEPVKLTWSTPCGDESKEYRYADHMVLVARPAPPGAGCFLSITANILNSSKQVSFSGDDCSDMDTRCEAFDGAGGEGGSD